MNCFVIPILFVISSHFSHGAAGEQPSLSKHLFIDISSKHRTVILQEIKAVQQRLKQGIKIRREDGLAIPEDARGIILNEPSLAEISRAVRSTEKDSNSLNPHNAKTSNAPFAHDYGFPENKASFESMNTILSQYRLPAGALSLTLLNDGKIPIQVWTYRQLKKLKLLMSCTTALQEKCCGFTPSFKSVYEFSTHESINKTDTKGRTALYFATKNWRLTPLSTFVHLLAQGADAHIAPHAHPDDTPFNRMQMLADQFTDEQKLAGFHNWTLQRRKIATILKIFIHAQRKRTGEKPYWLFTFKDLESFRVIKRWVTSKTSP